MNPLEESVRPLCAPRLRQTGTIDRILETTRRWWRVPRGRRELAELDDRMLEDIGMTREQVFVETSKYFWQR